MRNARFSLAFAVTFHRLLARSYDSRTIQLFRGPLRLRTTTITVGFGRTVTSETSPPQTHPSSILRVSSTSLTSAFPPPPMVSTTTITRARVSMSTYKIPAASGPPTKILVDGPNAVTTLAFLDFSDYFLTIVLPKVRLAHLWQD